MGGSEPCGGRLKIRAARLINPSHAKLPKMTRPPSEEYRKGLIYAFSCYLLWGLFPLYWFPITHSGMGADQILAQRICWSAVFSSAVLLMMRQAGPLLRAVRDRRLLLAFVCSAAAISVNWLVYLWAITHDHVLDASLGYFIAPLVNVLLGRIFFKEKLGFVQIAAVLLAVTGILWLAVPAGRLPWVSLLFAAAAKRIALGDLGMIQYISPSIQFFLGLTLFGEAFSTQRFAGYLWVWLGVAVYVYGVVRPGKKRNKAV